MKLIFETNVGYQFEMEVGNYDSLQAMKEKVEKNKGIPISKQTLSFNGSILRDDDDILNAIILDGSRIHVHIAADHPPPQEILIKMPAPLRSFRVEVDVNATIQQLKEKIQEMAATTPLMGRIVIKHQNGMELPDRATLHECQITLSPEVTVEFRPPSPEIIPFKLYFTESEKGIDVRAGVNTTIEKVKEKIQEMGRSPISISGIVMKHENGMELADDRTLLECEIPANSVVRVEYRPKMRLLVKLPGPKWPTPVEICSEATIEKLKEHLHETEGLPLMGRMVIRLPDGKELPDHKRLIDCEISSSTVVRVNIQNRDQTS